MLYDRREKNYKWIIKLNSREKKGSISQWTEKVKMIKADILTKASTKPSLVFKKTEKKLAF